MGGWFGRALRTAIPAVALIFWGDLSAQPWMLMYIPILNAISKALHDKFPNSVVVNWLPF